MRASFVDGVIMVEIGTARASTRGGLALTSLPRSSGWVSDEREAR
jgi:hypothetical protein